jgi:hypothetical protein
MQHDIEVYKIAIDDRDVGDMSPGEFKQRKSQAITTSSDNFILRQALSF